MYAPRIYVLNWGLGACLTAPMTLRFRPQTLSGVVLIRDAASAEIYEIRRTPDVISSRTVFKKPIIKHQRRLNKTTATNRNEPIPFGDDNA